MTLADSLPTFDGMKRRPRSPETVNVGNVMVRIYQRRRPTANGKKRTIYEVADYTQGIRQLRGFSDHTEARREAEQIARRLASGESEAAMLRGSEAASYGRAVELVGPTGMSLELAAANYAKAFDILGGDSIVEAARFYARHRVDQVTQRTVAEVVEELIAAKQARGKSARYIGDLSSRLKRFSERHVMPISSVTTPDVQRWLDGLKLAPQTAKNFRTVLYTLFSFAETRGYILKGGNPVADTEHISTNGGGAIEIYAPVEINTLLQHAPKAFLPVLALGAFAGLRSAEIERLEWSDIDLVDGFIHVAADKAKTASRRLPPILPNLAAWLTPFALEKGKVWKGTLNDLQEIRAETVKAAGIRWKDNGLRHSYISYRLAKTQNAAQVALEAGNSPAVIFRHYRELVKPDTAETWFGIVPQMPANVINVNAAYA